MDISELVGKTLRDVKSGYDSIHFTTDDGINYIMQHNQDCCEHVAVESIAGDLKDLIGTPILVAEERTSGHYGSVKHGSVPDFIYIEAWKTKPGYYASDSETWTFYTLRTIKGSVDIRWYGSSNGYYSESVDFERLPPETD